MAATATLDWLQTLADQTRIRLLMLLEQEELTVSELCLVVQLPQSTVSRHLKLLAADEWVANRRDGTNHLYRVELESWCQPRRELWQWVRRQADSPSTLLDSQRLARVISERAQWKHFFVDGGPMGQAAGGFIRPAAGCVHLGRDIAKPSHGGRIGLRIGTTLPANSPFCSKSHWNRQFQRHVVGGQASLVGFKNVQLKQSSLTELPLADASLDAAWLVLVLPYLSEPQDAIREAARVLKAAAPLVIVDLLPHDRSAYRHEMGHLRLGTHRSEIEQWLAEASLKLDRYHLLPPDPAAKGPALFAAIARPINPFRR
ncbi:MAG: metalloregulator ArsR/SmtB family transcription factor [Pirellulaceae bacterium]